MAKEIKHYLLLGVFPLLFLFLISLGFHSGKFHLLQNFLILIIVQNVILALVFLH